MSHPCLNPFICHRNAVFEGRRFYHFAVLLVIQGKMVYERNRRKLTRTLDQLLATKLAHLRSSTLST